MTPTEEANVHDAMMTSRRERNHRRENEEIPGLMTKLNVPALHDISEVATIKNKASAPNLDQETEKLIGNHANHQAESIEGDPGQLRNSVNDKIHRKDDITRPREGLNTLNDLHRIKHLPLVTQEESHQLHRNVVAHRHMKNRHHLHRKVVTTIPMMIMRNL